MLIHKCSLFYPILLSLTADLLTAYRQSVYVPNYHQNLDYSNIEDLQSLLKQQQEQNGNLQITADIDSTSPATESNDLLPIESSTNEVPHTSFAPDTTHSSSSTTVSAEQDQVDLPESSSTHENTDQLIDANSTETKAQGNHTDVLVHWSNETHIVRQIPKKELLVEIENKTRDEAAKQLFERRLMQSLMHLIPPNLWAQINNNRTLFQPNQTQYTRPFLPNPVLLAEAAAQAGLPGPGPYPIPNHFWNRNPSQIVTRSPPTTSTTVRTTTTTTPRAKPFSWNNPLASPSSHGQHSLFSQMGFTCPPNSNGVHFADRRLCNMYFTCSATGLPEPSLCPEGYLFSDLTRDCELAAYVNCGSRLSAYFELEETKMSSTTTTTTTTTKRTTTTPPSRSKIYSGNGTIDCILGADGYYEDPLYCNVYHHCIAGIDYIEPCPNQLAWNDKKKMCDWSPNVNCTGKTMPLIQGKTSFCTNRQDGRYPSDIYCNVFHHCIGGTDHIVRCTGELQWDDAKKECGWASSVRCGAPKKMLPNDNKLNSTFCTGKADGSYPHEEYCNVYHVCESGIDSMRQCPHQLYWDNEQKKCDWSNKVGCSGRTLVALAMESNLFCMEKSDGFYIDPQYCNVYHQCMADIDVKLQCPERLIFNATLQRCDWPESTTCKSGNILVEEEDNHGFCADKPNGNYAHEQYCNRYYICQNGKDVVFTCQNNLRYSIEKNECDWAVNVDCKGKADYMWEGIKENFCKRLPDGNYPDQKFCNLFHQCQAAMDYPKRCPNRLMFNEETKECDWEDKVDCKGREKFIDTEGLDDAVRPGSNNTRGRSTKFCMVKENGDYADLYYCNVYHNCHGGFDTIQYCANGLVWRQESEAVGRCDWPKERSGDGVDCTGKAVFFVEKLAEKDILANLRSEFCLSKGPGLYEHQRYCDLYLQCNEQGVGVTMECSPGLIFNEKKKECDYQGEMDDDESKGAVCVQPRSFLRSKPKAEQASILFEGVDATGQFPTHFDCLNKNQQTMFSDADWCNIYHVCVGSRDNIFLCPPGTIFNDIKQGCMDRFNGTNCNGTRSYYKPTSNRQKREEISPMILKSLGDFQQTSRFKLPNLWKKSLHSKESEKNAFKWQHHRP